MTVLKKAYEDTGVVFLRAIGDDGLAFNEFIVHDDTDNVSKISVAPNAPLRLVVDLVTLLRVESSLTLRSLASVPILGSFIIRLMRNRIAKRYYAVFNEMGMRR